MTVGRNVSTTGRCAVSIEVDINLPTEIRSATQLSGFITTMDAFRFSPELFQIRDDVMVALDRAGYQWLSHYSSVDCLHDLYGVEVCGIHEKEDAVAIRTLLMKMFPDWISGCLCHKDYGREPGWKAKIHRDRPRQRENWETA